MEATINADRVSKALSGIVETAERQLLSLITLSEALTGAMLSADVARQVIANKCEDTAKLIEAKL